MSGLVYKSGRSNLACTVFVPFNCGNNCPFCTSKKMYDGFEMTNECIEKICSQIKIANKNKNIKEFVITGGEPFANIALLDKFIKLMDKPVYINTSLPMMYNPTYYIDYINDNDRIWGVNISRHMGYTHESAVANLYYIGNITKPVRINTVVPKNFNIEKFDEFVEMYGSVMYSGANRIINLRADYRSIDDDNLKNIDTVKRMLLDRYDYLGSNGCLVCNTDIFEKDNGKVIQYHRGVEFSKMVCGTSVYVNDVIIDIHGNVFDDWDMKEPCEDFLKWFGSCDVDKSIAEVVDEVTESVKKEIKKKKETATKKNETKTKKKKESSAGVEEVFEHYAGGCGGYTRRVYSSYGSCGSSGCGGYSHVSYGCGGSGC